VKLFTIIPCPLKLYILYWANDCPVEIQVEIALPTVKKNENILISQALFIQFSTNIFIEFNEKW